MKNILLIIAGAILFTLSVSAGDKNEVTIDNFSFKPATLTVTAGTTVTWINRDDVPHTVVSTDKKTIASPALDTDEKFSFKFTVAGTNDYYCTIHPHMKGKIIVQ
jgi:amicyanin